MSCSLETLMRQASLTADQYFLHALDTIEEAEIEIGVKLEKIGADTGPAMTAYQKLKLAVDLAKVAAQDYSDGVKMNMADMP